MNRSLLVVTTFAVVGLFFSTALQAEIIKAGNDVLKKKGSKLYVPETAGSSGILGDPIPGSTRQKAGYQIEATRLAPSQVVQGYVAMELDFTVLTPEMYDDAVLQITVNDIDFKPQTVGSASLREWLGFSFLADKTDKGTGFDPEAAPYLVLDNTNYGNYRADGFGATNNKKITYSIPLTDLAADFDNIANDGEFAVVMTMYSSLTRAQTGTAGPYRNTSETFAVQVSYDPNKGPEPATMALLLAGAGMMLRRKR